jgi:hypothetical protein
VLPIHDAGTAACDRLPDHDFSAPRDCVLIRLALPAAIHDQVVEQITPVEQRVRELRGRTPPSRLPATESAGLETAFTTIEVQLDKLAALREQHEDPRVPRDLIANLDRKREQVFCTAVGVWSLRLDVEGATIAGVAPLTRRKEAMKDSLESAGLSSDCQPTADGGSAWHAST